MVPAGRLLVSLVAMLALVNISMFYWLAWRSTCAAAAPPGHCPVPEPCPDPSQRPHVRWITPPPPVTKHVTCPPPPGASTNRTCKEELGHLRWDPSRPVYALTGYMRSGNSWTRHLLQMATGIVTGSIYNDVGLQRSGLLGEGTIEGTIVTKTHLTNRTIFFFRDLVQMRAGQVPPYPTIYYPAAGCIHTIRNPFDSIASWHMYLVTGLHSKTVPLEELDADRWERHVLDAVFEWRHHTQYWMKLAHDPAFRYLRVRYEDLRKNTAQQLQLMLDHLEVAADPRRVQCALEVATCANQPMNCRDGRTGAMISYYSNEQREYVISTLGDLMTTFDYETEVPMDSKLDFVAPPVNRMGVPSYCRRSSEFEVGVDRILRRIRGTPKDMKRPPGPPLIVDWSISGWMSWRRNIRAADDNSTVEFFHEWAGVMLTKRPSKCRWTTDRKLAPNASAVLFSLVPHQDEFQGEWCSEPLSVPMQKPPYQHWAVMDYEVPTQFPIVGHKRLSAAFDWKIGYSKNSTIHITMHCPYPSPRGYNDPPPPKSPGHLVVYMASRCIAVEREAYVKELMKYIDVHAYGRCLHNRDMPAEDTAPWPRNWDQKLTMLGTYKFTLAFENDNVTDWVTEKLPQAVLAGSVPVYMGAPNVEEYYPGPHSVINVNDYESPKELAEYLLYLHEHDEEYQKYFDWKKGPLSQGFLQDRADCAYFQDEKLCDMLIAEQEAELSRKEEADALAAQEAEVDQKAGGDD